MNKYVKEQLLEGGPVTTRVSAAAEVKRIANEKLVAMGLPRKLRREILRDAEKANRKRSKGAQ